MEEDPERQPLLGSQGSDVMLTPSVASKVSTKVMEKLRRGSIVAAGSKKKRGVNDTMTYEVRHLTSVSGFLWGGAHSAFLKRHTWTMIIQLIFVSIIVAFATYSMIDDAAEAKESKFAEINQFLQLFVALLLGFYLSSSVNRWYTCVDGFMKLFDSIRNMQMQFYALGVPQEQIYTCLRYGVVSAVMLSTEMQVRLLPKLEREKQMENMYSALVSAEPPRLALGEYALITPSERNLLTALEDESVEPSLSGCMWIWVSSLIGRMAQDGEIPGMATPIYGRIMNLAMAAHAGIRQVKTTINVQAPFAYAHMMAVLVHVNNIFSAVSFGITLGLTIGTFRMHTSSIRTFDRHSKAHLIPVKQEELYRVCENLVISFITGIAGPVIYQVLLDVCICIAMPFDSKEAMIPTDKFVAALEKDLFDSVTMAENPASWDRPYFKPPATN